MDLYKILKKKFFALKENLERIFHPLYSGKIMLDTQKDEEHVVFDETTKHHLELDHKFNLREDQLEFVQAFVPHDIGNDSSRNVVV